MAENQLGSQRGFEPDNVPGVLSMRWSVLGPHQLVLDLRLLHICTVPVSAVFNRSGPMWHFVLKENKTTTKRKRKKKKREGRHCLSSNSPFCKMRSE